MTLTPLDALRLAIKALNQVPNHKLSGDYKNTYALIPELQKALLPVATSQLEICKMFTCSTAHIREITNDYIIAKDVATYYAEYGFIIYTTPYEDEDSPCEYPTELKALLAYAKQQGCDYLRLDRDGSTIEQFPTYEW